MIVLADGTGKVKQVGRAWGGPPPKNGLNDFTTRYRAISAVLKSLPDETVIEGDTLWYPKTDDSGRNRESGNSRSPAQPFEEAESDSGMQRSHLKFLTAMSGIYPRIEFSLSESEFSPPSPESSS